MIIVSNTSPLTNLAAIASQAVLLDQRKINYFAPDQVDRIRQDLGLKRHDETTQYDDFFEFLETGDFTMSYNWIIQLCYV